MPRPVEALPCGSRSMISTSSPMAASAVPRLIAVVVLPTPAFWLASASTRGITGGAKEGEDVSIMVAARCDAVGVRKAREYKYFPSLGPADPDNPPAWVGQTGDQL